MPFLIAVLLPLLLSLTTQAAPVPEINFKELPPVALKNAPYKSVKDLKGKVVLMDFWASWCEPCKKALPHYNDLYKKYRDQGLVVIAVNEDDDAKDRDDFLKTVQLDFPLYADKDRKYIENFKIVALPTLYLFDKKQKPVAMYRGYDESKAQVLEKQIIELLKAPSAD